MWLMDRMEHSPPGDADNALILPPAFGRPAVEAGAVSGGTFQVDDNVVVTKTRVHVDARESMMWRLVSEEEGRVGDRRGDVLQELPMEEAHRWGECVVPIGVFRREPVPILTPQRFHYLDYFVRGNEVVHCQDAVEAHSADAQVGSADVAHRDLPSEGVGSDDRDSSVQDSLIIDLTASRDNGIDRACGTC